MDLRGRLRSATLTIAFDAAEFAAIPSLVPSSDDLVSANGQDPGQLLGRPDRRAAAGRAADHGGCRSQQVLLVDAASFLLSAGLAGAHRHHLQRPPGHRGAPRRIRREVADGLRYVLGHPVLRNISAMMALINLVGATVYTQLVVFAKDQLDASDSRWPCSMRPGAPGWCCCRWRPARCGGAVVQPAALGALMLDGLLTVVLAATRWYWAAAGPLGGHLRPGHLLQHQHRQPAPADRPQPPARPGDQHRRRARLVGHPAGRAGRRLGGRAHRQCRPRLRRHRGPGRSARARLLPRPARPRRPLPAGRPARARPRRPDAPPARSGPVGEP